MSTRTLIEINHDQLHMLENERDCVFPQLLHALRSGEGPMWVGRSFVSGDGIRILGQRHHSEPEWAQLAPPMTREEVVKKAREAGAAKFIHERAGKQVDDETNMLVSVDFLERFARLVLSQPVGGGLKLVGYTCGEGDCGRIHDSPATDDAYSVAVYVPVANRETEPRT